MALWPQKYMYTVKVIRYSEPEQICVHLHVFSFTSDLCTSNITATFYDLTEEISK